MDPQYQHILAPAVPVLMDGEKALRDKFVAEYIKDYNELKACVRIGYAPAFAREFSGRFMTEPYVLNKIQAAENTVEDDFDEDTQKKKIVSALWREANNYSMGSSQSARVAALAKLSGFYGMDAPSRSQTELTGRDGKPLGQGVFIVPGLVTAEEWAKQAAEQQEELTKPQQSMPSLKIA